MPKVGQVWQFGFLDHARANGANMAPIRVRAYGEIVKIDKNAYYVATFIPDETAEPCDTEVLVIIKSTICSSRRLL